MTAPARRPTRVVLVRPWRAAHGGGGCCSGDLRGVIVFDERVDRPRHTTGHGHHDPLAEAYALLGRRLPGVDVQIVGVDNVAFLLPWAFRAARRRSGTVAALRHAVRATTAGAVLVDGVLVGDVESQTAPQVLDAVVRGLAQAGNGTSSTAATV